MNWFAITIMVIWIAASVATCVTKDSTCMGAALAVTVAMGIGWLMMQGAISLPPK